MKGDWRIIVKVESGYGFLNKIKMCIPHDWIA